MVGLPLCVASFLLSSYILKRTNGEKFSIEKKKGKEMDLFDNKNILEKLFTDKLIKFGGGFYGLTAFVTYIYIELQEVIDFIKNGTLSISFSAIISFIIESFVNFLKALVWPVYWMATFPIKNFFLWIIVAIAANALGVFIAKQSYKKSKNEH